MFILTVIPLLNQGVSGNRAVHLFPVAFFGPFFSKKKGQQVIMNINIAVDE
jgi:hypothetical protein